MSQRLVDGIIVGSYEASKEFIDLWKEYVDPEYKSPYPEGTTNRRSRMLEPYYFLEYDNAIFLDEKSSLKVNYQ